MNSSKRALSALVLAGLCIWLGGTVVATELDGPAQIVFDQYRVPTIVAQTEHDAIFLQGYMHARDRLWQMDFQRRAFSGTVSELLGSAAIPQDVQLRTLGLRRAAQRSLAVQTPETMAWLEAYSDGVNAFLASAEPLPPEFGALEIDRGGIPPWTPLDSLTVAKGLAFQLSFDLSDIDRTLALLNFLGVCNVLGCNGLQLFQDDLYRVAPFSAHLSIPPSPPPPGSEEPDEPTIPDDEEHPPYLSDPVFEDLVQDYRDEIADMPFLGDALEKDHTEQGSNWWVVSGALTDSGYPMLANDPHLGLGSPATFYEIHLNVDNGINVTGVSFPGAPGIVQGCNDTICWGSSVNSIDVTDVYNEVLVALDPSQPTTPTHTVFEGNLEPIVFIPQTFLFNVIGDNVFNNLLNAGVPADQGGFALTVPRRNNGPIVNVSFDPSSPTPLTGLSVAYVGWSATQELETFRLFTRATSMQDFKDALQFFDFGSQNWGYADINGNIAYYTSGELPIREDLQTKFFPDGLINPSLIRDGTHDDAHEWLPLQNPQPNQALSTEILPFAEMPQIENPAAGYILNANNDPIGTTFDNVAWNQFRLGFNGLKYLSSQYATGYRMGRIQQLFDSLLGGGGTVSTPESIDVQANNQLLDAEVLTPFVLDAYANATAPGAPPELTDIVADPRIGEAVGYLSGWDFSTPTGIDEGWDPGDTPGIPGPASSAEIDASVAATIYAAWRGKVVQRVIDGTLANLPVPLDAFAPGDNQAMAALRKFLDDYPLKGGTGASLINFFNVPGVADQDVARDIILLESLQQGLDLLASNEMAPAFGNSPNLGDYRWGKLHRVVFAHVLGGPFSIPPPGSSQNLSPDLAGFARAGGMGAVDASSHSARADGLDEFMFDSGPARRVVATLAPTGPIVEQIIPGGQISLPGHPNQTDQLFLWLVNGYHPLPITMADVNALAVETWDIVCGDGDTDPGEQCDDGNADGNDGCNQLCRITPIITCLDPTVSADAQTCDASIACSVIASCADPQGGAVTFFCAPGSPYALGTTNVNVDCQDAQNDTSATVCQATVEDTTPPSISVLVSPDELWPPNHRMVGIDADVTANDTCGTTSVVLESIVSDEPDDADGNGDGNTTDDIQNADYDTADFMFDLRAERAGGGDGRTYTVTYTATDEAGNTSSAVDEVIVPHDRGGMTDPVSLHVKDGAAGTAVTWDPVDGASSYNVIRTTMSNITDNGNSYDLGTVVCIEADSLDEDTYGSEDTVTPAPGEIFVYLVEYEKGSPKKYGAESAAKPRKPNAGNCN